jgi:hypothetical protein
VTGVDLSPGLIPYGAGDGNRTRTISLGICAVWAAMWPDLRSRLSMCARERPLLPGLMAANGPVVRQGAALAEFRLTPLFCCCHPSRQARASQYSRCRAGARRHRTRPRWCRSGRTTGHPAALRNDRERSTLTDRVVADGLVLLLPVGFGQRILDIAGFAASAGYGRGDWEVRTSVRPAFSSTRREAMFPATVSATTRCTPNSVKPRRISARPPMPAALMRNG